LSGASDAKLPLASRGQQQTASAPTRSRCRSQQVVGDPHPKPHGRQHLMMWLRAASLRAFELGTPGPMRHRLNTRVLTGEKLATAGLWQHDYLGEHESIDEVGERQALLDDDGDVIAVVEITRVETHRFVDVPWEFADAEGEDFRSIEHWCDGRASYYAQQGIEIDDDTRVVCVWFRVIDRAE
jgi:uncharacterized protein YhfF